jgi:spore coat polysaccharide biosynthesis protein SpsF
MNSKRLPYKVMMDLAGKPLLVRIVERIAASKEAGTIVVATTTDSLDDSIYKLCLKENINVFRGHPEDLLDRHYMAALKYKADAVVKIPSDCPLIDPRVITKVIQFYLMNISCFDYVSNLHPATYPDENDVEVMSFKVLEEAWKSATKPFEREHTTPYLWEHPHRYNIGNVYWETGLDYSMTHRWTIDYEEDYFFINIIAEELYKKGYTFSIQDILLLLQNNPALMDINSKYAGVNWYRHHLNELKTISANQTKLI